MRRLKEEKEDKEEQEEEEKKVGEVNVSGKNKQRDKNTKDIEGKSMYLIQ